LLHFNLILKGEFKELIKQRNSIGLYLFATSLHSIVLDQLHDGYEVYGEAVMGFLLDALEMAVERVGLALEEELHIVLLVPNDQS
jgi:hypothetical protein